MRLFQRKRNMYIKTVVIKRKGLFLFFFSISVTVVVMYLISGLLAPYVLELAKNNNIHTIVFPSISTGVYGYPIEKAAHTALSAINEWCNKNADYDMDITLSCFDDNTLEIYTQLLKQ